MSVKPYIGSGARWGCLEVVLFFVVLTPFGIGLYAFTSWTAGL